MSYPGKQRFMTTPKGRRFHMPSCPEVDLYKAPNARSLTSAEVRKRQLIPCKVCKPGLLMVIR